jgi:dolichyl-phosphate-mannose--protein O-mannosyl transferase
LYSNFFPLYCETVTWYSKLVDIVFCLFFLILYPVDITSVCFKNVLFRIDTFKTEHSIANCDM